MNTQLSNTSQNFLQSIHDDIPVVRMFKYRYYLSTHKQTALDVFEEMARYALQNRMIGEYESLYETAKKDISRTQQYRKLRQELVDHTNPLRQETEHAEAISNLEDMINGYYRLAEYYRQLTMHKDSCYYYNKLYRVQSGSKIIYQRSQYFSAWAQELYFDNSWNQLGIFVRNDIEDQKLLDVNLAIIKDLKFIELGHGANQFFPNLLNNQTITLGSIIDNSVISFKDLGFIFSLVLLAKKDRNTLKIKAPWSAKLEVLYLQNRFKQLLEKIHDFYETHGKFNPLIDQIDNKLVVQIRQRVLIKFLSVYQSVSLKEIQSKTTFSEGAVRQFLKQYQQQPYLIDPISQSVVYYPKSIPLYNETVQYEQLIKDKFRQTVKHWMGAKKTEEGIIEQWKKERKNKEFSNQRQNINDESLP